MLGRVLTFVAALFTCSVVCGAENPAVTKLVDRIEQVSFTSQAFGATKHFCVVLPADHDPSKTDQPVLYLLHGRGRNDRSLIDSPTARAALLKAPFITVLPNGEDGWYLDSPASAKNAYASLLKETIAQAEARYHVSQYPKWRAIAGWSMGGYGAVRFAEAHPASFAMVASMIGLLDFPRSGLPEGQSYNVPVRTFGVDEATWKPLNPLNSAEQLRGSQILLIAADQAFDRTMNEHFHERLGELKIEHEWIMFHGEHQFDVVEQAVPLVIERVKQVFHKQIDGPR